MVDNCTGKSAKFKSLGYTDWLVSLMGESEQHFHPGLIAAVCEP